MKRRVRWFGCGAASATAIAMDLKANPGGVVAYCETRAAALSSLLSRYERMEGLLSCVASGLAIACEGGISNDKLVQLWIDPHGLRSDIADALGRDPLSPEEK